MRVLFDGKSPIFCGIIHCFTIKCVPDKNIPDWPVIIGNAFTTKYEMYRGYALDFGVYILKLNAYCEKIETSKINEQEGRIVKYFITRLNGAAVQSTAAYAQGMVADIAHQLGFKEIAIYFYNFPQESNESLSSRFDGIIAGIQRGDIIVFQYPTWNHGRFEIGLINRIKAYGGRVVIFIHDIEALMFESSRFMLGETIEIFNMAECLIVPSDAMKQFLLNNGVKVDMKFVIQEIFDYITDINFIESPKFIREIHFAGSPDQIRKDMVRYRIFKEWHCCRRFGTTRY